MDKLDAPLYNAVKRAASAEARFCMPSHAGMAEGPLFASAPFDFTEVEGLDNLACPSGVILEAESKAAEAQGVARTLFVTEGSTACMHIALSLAKARGGVACIGDMHRSFYGGCALLGMVPLCFGSVAEFLRYTRKNKDVSAVFYTSPDYFGNVADDAELVSECAKKGILTVADSAHGAHFCYSRLLPDALSGKADVSFCSTHKTMAAYTGGALLNLKDDSMYDEAVYARQLRHTTSPSYLVMASTDYCRALWQRDGEKFYADIKARIEEFRQNAQGAAYTVEKSDDFSRLVLRFEGYDAAEASEYLVGKGIYAEAAIGDRLIFIVNPFNADKLVLLRSALGGFSPSRKYEPPVLPVRERRDVCGAAEFVPLDRAEGRVCLNEIGFYPPGTPFIGRGEVFTADDVAILTKNVGCTFGLVNGKAFVLQ